MIHPHNLNKIFFNVRNFLLTHPIFPYTSFNGKTLTSDATKVLICCIYSLCDINFNDYLIQPNFINAYLENKMSEIEIYNSLVYLQDANLICNLVGNKSDYQFKLTYEALYFFELKRKQMFSKLLVSIVIPLTISVITTLITLMITNAI